MFNNCDSQTNCEMFLNKKMNLATNKVRSDGFGAQYQFLICMIVYCELNLLEFIYTPVDFKTVYDNDGDNVERIMNIRPHFRNISDLTCEELKNLQYFDYQLVYSFFEYNIDLCLKSKSLEKLRNLFNTVNMCPILDYENRPVIVAVHIRRPSMHKNIDIAEHHNGLDVKSIKDVDNLPFSRFTNNKYFLDTIKKIRTMYKEKNTSVLFKIFSEGDEENFEIFKSDDVELCLNKNISNTFSCLVNSDVLVMSKSSFSYAAAILSLGRIYYTNFWHRKASHWLIV